MASHWNRFRELRWAAHHVFLVVVISFVSLVIIGCRRSDPALETAGNSLPYAGIEIYVVLPEGLGLATSWTPGLEDWAAGASAAYSVSERDLSGVAADHQQWWKKVPADRPTLVVLPTTATSLLLAENRAAPIPASALMADAIRWSSTPPPVRKALGMLGDRPTALAMTSEPLVAFYRRDLLEAAGRAVPETWEEYDDLVATIADWAPGHIAVEPRDAQTLATLFLARAVAGAKTATQYSFELDVSTGDPLISTEPFVRALEGISRLTSRLPEEWRAAPVSECCRAALDGRAAIGITAFGVEAGTNDGEGAPGEPPNKSDVDLAFTSLPGSRSVFDRDSSSWNALGGAQVNRPALCGFNGFSVCVINGDTELEQAAAWDLWGNLIAVQEEGIIPSLPGIPTRPSVLSAAVQAAAGSLPAASIRSLEQAILANHQNPMLVAELPCVGRERLLAALTASLQSSLEDGGDAQQVLNEAARAWGEIIDELGRGNVLNSYRRRLGLSPLP